MAGEGDPTGSSGSRRRCTRSFSTMEAAAGPDPASRSSIGPAAGSCAILASGRRRIVEVGTAYRLLHPVDGAGPAAGRDDRDDRSGRDAHDPGARVLAGGRDRGRTDRGGLRAGARGVRGRRPAARSGRSTWPSSTPSSPSTAPTSRQLVPRLSPGALVVADNVLWSGRTSGVRPSAPGDAHVMALRAFCTSVMGDPRFRSTILPVGDGLLVATYLGAAG